MESPLLLATSRPFSLLTRSRPGLASLPLASPTLDSSLPRSLACAPPSPRPLPSPPRSSHPTLPSPWEATAPPPTPSCMMPMSSSLHHGEARWSTESPSLTPAVAHTLSSSPRTSKLVSYCFLAADCSVVPAAPRYAVSLIY